MRRSDRISLESLITLLIMCACFVPGCMTNVPAEKYQAVQKELQAANERITLLETQISAQAQTINTLRKQIANLAESQGEGDPAEILVVPERIELAGMSGGYDSDGNDNARSPERLAASLDESRPASPNRHADGDRHQNYQYELSDHPLNRDCQISALADE